MTEYTQKMIKNIDKTITTVMCLYTWTCHRPYGMQRVA